jgi:hypothetical protein
VDELRHGSAAAALDLDARPFAGLAEEPERPSSALGLDERRIQLRAYELWNRLLGAGYLPSIEDLDPSAHPSLSPFGVLLDFTGGEEDPQIAYLGESLAAECDIIAGDVARVSDMPKRSLLARIAEHYLRALISAEPIGFEAEFVNQRDKTILYRGILLPFSRSGTTIDFVFGVISWKEVADRALVGDLMAELGRALASGPRIDRPSPARQRCPRSISRRSMPPVTSFRW